MAATHAAQLQVARLIGRVSMDMLTVDLTGLDAAGIGSDVQLWGDKISVDAVAQAAGTTAYEVLCNVKRVARAYVAADMPQENRPRMLRFQQ